MVIIRHTITSVAEDVEKLEHSYFTARSINGTATLENNLAVPQKVKHRVIIWPYNSTLRYILKRTRNICLCKKCVHTFSPALFTLARKWKYPKCPSANKSIHKMWYIHTKKYYSAIRSTDTC